MGILILEAALFAASWFVASVYTATVVTYQSTKRANQRYDGKPTDWAMDPWETGSIAFTAVVGFNLLAIMAGVL